MPPKRKLVTLEVERSTRSAVASTSDAVRPLSRSLTVVESESDSKNATTKKASTTTSSTSTTTSNRDWQIVWHEIETMRKLHDAAVDTMGCSSFGDAARTKLRHPELDEQGVEDRVRFHILVSLMLSSQTKDTETFKAMQRLFDWGLSVESILAVDDAKLNAMIANVGFHNKKVQYLKRTAQQLTTLHNGHVPDSLDALVALPGVGPKMAHLTLQHGFGIVLGVSVDTHVHRIAARLGEG